MNIFTLVVQIFVLILLFFLGAFFSGVETALIAISRTKTKILITKYPNKERFLKIWFETPNEVLTTLLVGVNTVAVAAATLSASMANSFAEYFTTSKIILTFISGFVVAMVIIFFGEVAPKIFAMHNVEKTVLYTIKPLYYLNKIIIPFTNFFTKLAVFVIKLFGGKFLEPSPLITREEIKSMIKLGGEVGAIKDDEGTLLHNVFKFNEKFVRDEMIPLDKVSCINIDDSVNNILRLATEEDYTRMPVYKGSKSNIIGIIHTKELLNILANKKLFILIDLLRTPYFVSEDKKISELLSELKEKRLHMAIVKNKDNQVVGLITLEDLIQEIVGYIGDEYGSRN
ncbi:MAG: hemolysin family protein [Candidatus Firestonebacteria bacterium]